MHALSDNLYINSSSIIQLKLIGGWFFSQYLAVSWIQQGDFYFLWEHRSISIIESNLIGEQLYNWTTVNLNGESRMFCSSEMAEWPLKLDYKIGKKAPVTLVVNQSRLFNCRGIKALYLHINKSVKNSTCLVSRTHRWSQYDRHSKAAFASVYLLYIRFSSVFINEKRCCMQ